MRPRNRKECVEGFEVTPTDFNPPDFHSVTFELHPYEEAYGLPSGNLT
jgi:hypothetical protein